MRRLLLLPLLLVAVVLAGCGGSGGGGDETEAARAAADPGAFPAKITHALGTTTVAKEPKRIVTVGLRDQDALLALGVKAVGSMDWFQQGTFAKWPWENWGGRPPEIVSSEGFDINYERVAALRPDLILGVYQELKPADYKKLSDIAPTIAQSKDFKPYTTPWREETRTIAAAVGRKAEGERLIKQVGERFAKVREEHPEFKGRKAVVVDPSGDNVYVFGSTDPRGQVLGEMGFAKTPQIDALTKGEFGTELSSERLDLLDTADYVFALVDKNNRNKLFDNPTFKKLKVARENRVVSMPYYDKPQYGAAMAFNSVLSLPYAIDGTLKQIAAIGGVKGAAAR